MPFSMENINRREERSQANHMPLEETGFQMVISKERAEAIGALRKYIYRAESQGHLKQKDIERLRVCQEFHDTLLVDNHLPMKVIYRNLKIHHGENLENIRGFFLGSFRRTLRKIDKSETPLSERVEEVWVESSRAHDRAIIQTHQMRAINGAMPEASLFQKVPIRAEELQFYKNGYADKGELEHTHGAFADITKNIKAQITRAREGQPAHILLAGWSIGLSETLPLQNENGELEIKTLQEWLTEAANAGVKVFLLSWYNRGVDADGTQNTKDLKKLQKEVTKGQEAWKKNFFVKFSSRGDFWSLTDHQKMQIFPEQNTAFVGGLDLMQGRADDSNHPHKNDQPELGRYNWSDAHARLHGEGVVNMQELFRMRWLNAQKPLFIASRRAKEQAAMSDRVIHESWLGAFSASQRAKEGLAPAAPKATIQLLTSLSSDAVDEKKCSHFNTQYIARAFFSFFKKVFISKEIMDHYIDAIKSAERYIYMENQYFSGADSASSRKDNQVINALIEKIAEKHAEYEAEMAKPLPLRDPVKSQPFLFECTLPYRPAGEPEDSLGVKLVLHRQWQCLNYFIDAVNAKTGGNALRYLRFQNPMQHHGDKLKMIYVHSKLLVVDGKRAIVGSANNNLRSMEGQRDTEVAIEVISNGDQGVEGKILEIQRAALRELHGDYIDSLTDDDLKNYNQARIQNRINGRLDRTLLHPDRTRLNKDAGFALPWGCVSRQRLFNHGDRQAPHHVPEALSRLITFTLKILNFLKLPAGRIAD